MFKPFIVPFVVILLMLGAVQSTVRAQEMLMSSWTADYYDNANLAGEPNFRRQDEGIGFQWGAESPTSDLPADFFSVRWSKRGFLPAGTYRFIVSADEGFRLSIDGQVWLDTWDDVQPGTTLGVDVALEAGEHEIVLEYREFSGGAYIFLDWGPAPGTELNPQPVESSTRPVVIVEARLLNVRTQPRIANNVLARIREGEQYPLLAYSEDGLWVQVDLGNGTTGWVSSAYITIELSTP